MSVERAHRDRRDPRHPANRRLIWSAWACMGIGLVLCIASLKRLVPFALGWSIACVFIVMSSIMGQRYRLRVRPLTRLEHLIGVLVVVLIVLAIGFAGPPLLVWMFGPVARP